MRKLAAQLLPSETDQAAFLDALCQGYGSEQAIVVLKESAPLLTFPKLPAAPWQPDFVTRIQDSFRPGAHPLYDAGAYYVLDLSSVFAASPLSQIVEPPRRVLDMCSAPGGKAFLAYRTFRDTSPNMELYCNEVIRKRTGMLISNLERCKVPNASVTTWDPAVWAGRHPEAFDLVLVDAPCSGQSLLAKGGEAEGCFHPKMVGMNASRQRRILANAAKCVAPGGHLLYMTCTFSQEENEKVIQWFLKGNSLFEAVSIKALDAFQSDRMEAPAYRLYPQMGWGAGAFTCLLKHSGAMVEALDSLPDLKPIWRTGDPPRKPRQSANPPVTKTVKLRQHKQGRSHRRR